MQDLDKELKEQALKEKDCIVMHNYRRISTRITKRLVKTNITPVQVTFIGFIIGIASAFFYGFGKYHFLLIGALLYNINYLLDCVDGEIARVKKIGTEFGAWFDAVSDDILGALVLIGSALGIYRLTKDESILIISAFAIANILIISLIIDTRKLRMLKHKDTIQYSQEVKFTSRYYLGYKSIMLIIFTLGAVFNAMFYVIVFYATIGTLIWITQILKFYKLSKKIPMPHKS